MVVILRQKISKLPKQILIPEHFVGHTSAANLYRKLSRLIVNEAGELAQQLMVIAET